MELNNNDLNDNNLNNNDLNNNKLNCPFKLYFHDPNSYNWDIGSYIEICEVKTIEDFWLLNQKLSEKIHLGMFFLMRNNIFPLWDNEDNIDGCTFSFKILKTETKKYWISICTLLLSEKLLKDEFVDLWEVINGISISPKKNFCIIKVWLKKTDICDNKNVNEYFNIPENYNGDIIFKNHRVTEDK
tara:strand:- start:343 stop:900 length:558 start_codon:yes stop_codon:yes gene_type:complete